MIDQFLKVKVRESAGSISASRFDYQKDWSICKLLEEHNKQSDYLFIFDYHDDLIIMDSEANPSKISFYQIKGKKNGKWSLNDLVKSDLSKDKSSYLLSIIGKLYSHKINFVDKVDSVNFVSNASFKVSLSSNDKSESKSTICIVELTPKDKIKIHEKLKTEHQLSQEDVAFESISFLRVVELSLDDSSTHTTGKLANFLNDRNPQKKYNVPLIYKVLFDEVKRRTSYSKEINDVSGLLENKAISKTKFNQMLDRIGVDKDYDEIWNKVQLALSNEHMAYSNILNYKKHWDKLQIERMSYNNEHLFNMLDIIRTLIKEKELNGDLSGFTLTEMVSYIYGSLSIKGLFYDKSFIEVAIISELHD